MSMRNASMMISEAYTLLHEAEAILEGEIDTLSNPERRWLSELVDDMRTRRRIDTQSRDVVTGIHTPSLVQRLNRIRRKIGDL